MERAVLADLGVLQDPHAAGMLAPSMRAVHQVVRRLPRRRLTGSVTLAGLAARVRWFDARVAEALDAGVDQVVTVGAGYDSRPWRGARDGVRFFEVDHRATQQDKIARAPGPGPVFVEADLAADDAAAALAAHGLDPDRRTLYVVEGVTMYLTEAVLRDQLAGLAAASAPGSRLALDVYPAAASTTAPNRRQQRLQRLARAGSGEGLRLGFTREAAVDLVERAGWPVTTAISLRDAAVDLVPATSGLPVNAIDPGKTLLAATHP